MEIVRYRWFSQNSPLNSLPIHFVSSIISVAALLTSISAVSSTVSIINIFPIQVFTSFFSSPYSLSNKLSFFSSYFTDVIINFTTTSCFKSLCFKFHYDTALSFNRMRRSSGSTMSYMTIFAAAPAQTGIYSHFSRLTAF